MESLERNDHGCFWLSDPHYLPPQHLLNTVHMVFLPLPVILVLQIAALRLKEGWIPEPEYLAATQKNLSIFVTERAWDMPFEWENFYEMSSTYFLFEQPSSSGKYLIQELKYEPTNSE